MFSVIAKKTFLVSVKCSGASGPELAAQPGLLEAAERRVVAHRRVRVHRQVAGFHGARHPHRPRQVVGPDRPGQSVRGVVGQLDRVGLVLERQHGDHGPEDLLGDRAVGALRGQNRWREPVSGTRWGRTAERDGRVVGHVGRHGVEVRPGHQRAHLGVPRRRIADDDALHGRLEQFHELVVDVALHQDSAARAAVLPGVVEHAVWRGGGGLLQVAVVEDDVGALAAEFQRHPLHLLRRRPPSPSRPPRWNR